MKEYEKLAEEYLFKEYAGESRDEIEPSFIAGFLKAREMILRYLEVACDRNFIIAAVEQVGEKEV